MSLLESLGFLGVCVALDVEFSSADVEQEV